MSYFAAKYYNSTNQFYPWCNNWNAYPFFVGQHNDVDHYCYYCYLLGKYVISRYTVTPFSLYDQDNSVDWTIQPGVYPTFQGRLNRTTMYIYKIDNYYYCSDNLYAQPIEYNKVVYDGNGSITTQQVSIDYYKSNSSSFNNGMTFTGYGAYQGMSFTVRLKTTTYAVYINNNSTNTNPYGVYTPYNEAASGNRYLGNKYWTWNNKQFVLSPNRRYNKDWKSGDRYYQISNIEYIYNPLDNKHRWVIWGDDTKTWGYENNNDYPIQAVDYIYTPFGKDGLQSITLTFGGYTLGNWTNLFYTIDYARAY